MIRGQEKVGCEECDHRGWIHSHEPFEIQQCDTCCGSVEEWSDMKAAKAHRLDCGCDWPSTDFQDRVRRGVFYAVQGTVQSPAQAFLLEAHKFVADRRRFAVNLPTIMTLVGAALRAYDRSDQKLGAREYVETVCNDLLVIYSLVSAGAWKDHWLWHFSDGTIIDGKWKARPIGQKYRLIQGSFYDNRRPDKDFMKKVGEYMDKIRALGGNIHQLHDEMMINMPSDPEKVGQVLELTKELSTYQITEQLKQINRWEALPLETGYEGKTWDELSEEVFDKVLTKHEPNLRNISKAVEEARRKRPNPELDYKKIYALIQEAENNARGGFWNGFLVNLEAIREHLLEIHPDANIPKEGS
jgi:hypothetical protein